MCKEVPRGTQTVIKVESDAPREDVLLPAVQPAADIPQVIFLR